MRVLPILATLLALSAPMAQADPVITVTAEGRVAFAPDIATISLGVTTQGDSAADAMAANSASMAVVLANLRAAGVADRDLQTTGLSLNPNYNYNSPGGTPRIDGYTAANQLTATIRTLANLGSTLDAAVKDGANTLNGVTFGLADPEPALDEARKRAVAEARRRAELLTTAAGVKLGKVESITETNGYAPPFPQFRMEKAAQADSVPVAEGEVSLSASVTITWELNN